MAVKLQTEFTVSERRACRVLDQLRTSQRYEPQPRDEKLLLRLRGQLAKQHLLVLDELGYVPASKVGAELLFDLVGQAYERLTGAALDRLTHRGHILELSGESYRLQDARRRRRNKNKE